MAGPHTTMELEEFGWAVLPWFAFFHGLFWALKIVLPSVSPTYRAQSPADRSYWAASIVSNVHAVYICYTSALGMIEVELFRVDDLFRVSHHSALTNRVFVGYLAADIILALYYNSQWGGWQANIIHHTAGLIGWTTFATGGCCHPLTMIACSTEITTPFINQRWFFDKMGMKSSPLYFWNGLIFAVLWFLFRILFFGWLGLRLFAMRADLLALPAYTSSCAIITYIVGYALQLFWFRKIAKGVMKGLSGGFDKGKSAAKKN